MGAGARPSDFKRGLGRPCFGFRLTFRASEPALTFLPKCCSRFTITSADRSQPWLGRLRRGPPLAARAGGPLVSRRTKRPAPLHPHEAVIRPTEAARRGPPPQGRPQRPPRCGGWEAATSSLLMLVDSCTAWSVRVTFRASEPAPTSLDNSYPQRLDTSLRPKSTRPGRLGQGPPIAARAGGPIVICSGQLHGSCWLGWLLHPHVPQVV